MSAPRFSRASLVGLLGLAVLLGGSYALDAAGTFARPERCPLPFDVEYDATSCSLLVQGLRVSLLLGLGAAVAGTALGLGLALLARWLRGPLEGALVRGIDAFFALPDVLVLLFFQYVLDAVGRNSAWYRAHPLALTTGALALVSWSGAARVLRDRLLTLEQREYVLAAQALGASRWHLLRRHLWPALSDTVLVLLLNRLPAAVLTESTASYIGIGNPGLHSLGRYLARVTREMQFVSPAGLVLPAWGALVLLVLFTMLAARGLRR